MNDWPFPDPPNVAALTVRQIIHEDEPILLVCRDAEDGSWQFLAGGPFEVADGLLVSLRTLVERDPRLAELADLPPGWQAWRPRPDSPWERELAEPDEDHDDQE
ncbi:hypothetical protein [Planctomyces sp. SH-PL62]|uniref:hypothetical protein n=1 Tax=Planctomyces sp. SH-PL62 TaxID=1636152 RepID=UPI00078E7C31|nr:hypothetical protein [Planctomyces sp. SH-PL62]AMV37267.1 hypothetical protein VT85_07530 [Planctomyces sp. SH-PL62]